MTPPSTSPLATRPGLASTLVDVLGDEHRRSLIIQRGRVRAKEFSWSRTARETADAYRLITGEAPTAVS